MFWLVAVDGELEGILTAHLGWDAPLKASHDYWYPGAEAERREGHSVEVSSTHDSSKMTTERKDAILYCPLPWRDENERCLLNDYCIDKAEWDGSYPHGFERFPRMGADVVFADPPYGTAAR